MTGFPPVDDLYYEHPSLRIGGSIARQLEIEKSNTLYVFPVKDLSAPEIETMAPFHTLPEYHFDSLQELIIHLKDTNDESFYYRGQTARHQARYKGHIQRMRKVLPQDGPFKVHFESLIPSKFREEVGTDYPDWNMNHNWSFIDQVAPAIRAILQNDYTPIRDLLARYFEFIATTPDYTLPRILQRWGVAEEPPETGTVSQTQIPDHLYKLISLSQHYGFKSIMTDITSDLNVAAWFASHNWDGSLADGSKNGVIYRFDSDRINTLLKKELENESAVGQEIMTSDLLGIVDIENIDPKLGSRPKAQSGGSIFGMVNSIVYVLLAVYSALEIYTFPLDSIKGDETSLSKKDLCPSDDPIVDILDPTAGYSDNPITAKEIVDFLQAEGFTNKERERVLAAKKSGIL